MIRVLLFPLRLACHFWVEAHPIDWSDRRPASITIFEAERRLLDKDAA